jgi:hypothetical protein
MLNLKFLICLIFIGANGVHAYDTAACLIPQGRSWAQPPQAAAADPTDGNRTWPATPPYNLESQRLSRMSSFIKRNFAE